MTERIFFLQQHEGVKSRLCVPAWLARILRLRRGYSTTLAVQVLNDCFVLTAVSLPDVKEFWKLYWDLCVGKKHLMLLEQEQRLKRTTVSDSL